MNGLLIFFCALLLSLSLNAQDFHPSKILDYPTIHPDSIKVYQERISDFEKGQLPTALIDEQLLSEGPFSTFPIGCSWYCMNGPNKVVGSSELDSSKVANYNAENAHDFDISTAWVEGQEGHGEGEVLDFHFKMIAEQITVNSATIYNGYCKSLSSWKANSRVKSFDVFANDVYLGVFHLKDTYLGQVFEFDEFKGDENGKLILSFAIKEVYPGDKYQDTCISEINFDGTGDH